MRTTLDIDDDVLRAAKKLARQQAMTGSKPSEAQEAFGVAGFRPFSTPSTQLVTNQLVDAIRDHDGI